MLRYRPANHGRRTGPFAKAISRNAQKRRQLRLDGAYAMLLLLLAVAAAGRLCAGAAITH